MIIGKDFVFHHIPKCGGSSLRQQLLTYSVFDFTNVINKTDLGEIDYVHLNQKLLRHFNLIDELNLNSKRQFTVVRDPSDRLASSVYQFLAKKKKSNSFGISRTDISDTLSYLIKSIDTYPGYFCADLVHFTPQHSYLYEGDNLKVDRVFTLQDVSTNPCLISEFLELPAITLGQNQQSVNYSIDFSKLNVLRKIIPQRFSPFYGKIKKRFVIDKRIFKSAVEDVVASLDDNIKIREFYERDYDFYNEFLR